MMTDRDRTTRTERGPLGRWGSHPPGSALSSPRPDTERDYRSDHAVHEGRRQTGRRSAHAGSRLKLIDVSGRSRLIRQPSSRTGENPPYGMIGRIEETSASFEARSAPRSDPTACMVRIRYDAVQRSSAVTRGKVTEHIVPYLPGFDLNPKDIRFLGTPIDLIAFKGLNNSMEEIEIVFIEVKTGGSALSARERAVKKAVEQKRVGWRVFNPDVEVGRQKIPIAADGTMQ